MKRKELKILSPGSILRRIKRVKLAAASDF